MPIKFNDLYKQWSEIKHICQPRIDNLLENSAFILGDDVDTFEKNFANYIGTKYAVGVSSGYDAIKLLIATREYLTNEYVDVYIPANTFIATILAVEDGLKSIGARYNLNVIDCDEFYQIDISQLEYHIQKSNCKFSLIIPVHLCGQPYNVQDMLDLQLRYHVDIIDDCAQACGSKHMIGNVGTFFDSAFSLYPGKNLGAAGDAGIITTDNDIIYDRLMLLRNYGSRVKYEHEIFGYNCRLDSLQAIIVDEKLKYLNEWNLARNNIAKEYDRVLGDLKYRRADYCTFHNFHLYVVRVANRERVIDKLKENQIEFGIHYPIPIELTQVYEHRGWNSPNTRGYCDEILSLPCHQFMHIREAEFVATIVKDYCGS